MSYEESATVINETIFDLVNELFDKEKESKDDSEKSHFVYCNEFRWIYHRSTWTYRLATW